jgi:hypothetical protein
MVMAPALWSMVSNLSRTLAELPVLSRVSAAA